MTVGNAPFHFARSAVFELSGTIYGPPLDSFLMGLRHPVGLCKTLS